MSKILFLSILITFVSCGSSKSKYGKEKSQNEEVQESTDQKTVNKSSSEEETNIKEKVEVVCKWKNDERTISNSSLKSGGCSVNYNKFGKDKEVASAKYETSHCQKIADRIKNRLLEAGFECK